MIKKEDVFKIGQFAKPHGIKGEIALVTNSDVFDDSDDPYIICEMDGILVPFFIEEYRYKTDTVILLKLKNVDDEKAAREFSNREVFYSLDEVDRDDLVGDMTWDSFIGYRVIDRTSWQKLARLLMSTSQPSMSFCRSTITAKNCCCLLPRN